MKKIILIIPVLLVLSSCDLKSAVIEVAEKLEEIKTDVNVDVGMNDVNVEKDSVSIDPSVEIKPVTKILDNYNEPVIVIDKFELTLFGGFPKNVKKTNVYKKFDSKGKLLVEKTEIIQPTKIEILRTTNDWTNYLLYGMYFIGALFGAYKLFKKIFGSKK